MKRVVWFAGLSGWAWAFVALLYWAIVSFAPKSDAGDYTILHVKRDDWAKLRTKHKAVPCYVWIGKDGITSYGPESRIPEECK